MHGIVFFKTGDLGIIREFYSKVLELPIWLEQGACVIFRNGNQLLGFCQSDNADTEGTITFFFESRSKVQEAFKKFRSIALDPPRENPKFSIFHFWAKDPEGRDLEFQSFDHTLEPFISLEDGLMQRRSIRHYHPSPVPDELMNKVFELCRYSPTARNLQSYYYIVVKQREALEQIVNLRGPAGDPILASPYAVAVVARGDLARRKVQDACIAAYHLLLAAKAFGLGTCWVTDMDRDEVKDILKIPHDDYIACLTPIGFPAEEFALPKRHEVSSFVRYL